MDNTAAMQEFLKPLQAAPKVIADARKQGLRASADVAKVSFLGAPGAPHGLVAHKPLGVTTKVLEESAYVKWGRSAVLVNDDTKAHDIHPKGFVGTRSTGRKAQRGAAFLAAVGLDAHAHRGGIVIPGVGVRASAHHPGTKGKHFVEKGKATAAEEIPKTYQRVQHEALATIFKG